MQKKGVWALIGAVVVVLVGLCAGTAWFITRGAPMLGRVVMSDPLKEGEIITGENWSMTAPDPGWRRLKPASLAKMPLPKAAWLTRSETDTWAAVEQMTPQTPGNQFVPALLGEVLRDNYREGTSKFEEYKHETIETCGSPAEIYEFRAVRDGLDATYVMGAFVAYNRGYQVDAWALSSDWEELAPQLRKLVRSFCPIDTDFDREWMRNFVTLKGMKALDEHLKQFSGERLNLESISLHYKGVKRLGRKELERHAQLRLAMVKGASAKECAGVWLYDLAALETRLQTLQGDDIRDWYRLERRAQDAEVNEESAQNIASEAERQAALNTLKAPKFKAAWSALFDDLKNLSDDDVCNGTTMAYEHALSREGDDREALLRALMWID